jgi:hypothetical protein
MIAKKYPLTIEWAGGGREVKVLGTFSQRKELLLRKMYVRLRWN